MPRMFLTAVCFALLANCSVAHPNAERAEETKFATEVPLLDCDGLPCVEARIGDGAVLKMGIDTGNANS
ncbi:MAG: hypothetical protein WBE10_05740, partial [Candidatus Acidiferrum sp.]